MKPFSKLIALVATVVAMHGPALMAYDSIVVFNEIQYHPAGLDDPRLEFVELYNQNSVDVDLSGWRLSGGVDFEFATGTILAGRGYLVVAADPPALQAATGINGVRGPFLGMLDNGGESIRLRNNNDRIMDEVEYNDRPFWPVGADGSGASLSKIDPQSSGSLASAWAHSLQLGGTPGTVNFNGAPVPLQINEVAGSAAGEGSFFVEIHNSGTQDLDLGGYVIASESGAEHIIAPGVMAPQSSVVSLTETVLGFRTADGDNLHLFLPGRSGLLDAVRTDDAGRARLPDGSEALYATGSGIAETPGAPNPAPPTSPVVINEIMYHHRPTYANGAVPFAPNNEEWIELRNITDVPVPVGGWELRGAIRYTIPEGVLIPEAGFLVVARDLAAFAAKFPGVQAVGDFSGSLSNRGEELFLFDATGSPADEVFYRDGAPWPDEADGGGSSLELRNPTMDNSAPEAWAASDNSPISEWHDYEFTLTASNPAYSPAIFNFHELRIGLLDSGVVLLDDVSVVEDPGGAAIELITNGDFRSTSNWRRLGTHQGSRLVNDSGVRALRILAEGRMNYMNNLIETNLTTNGNSLRAVRPGIDYRVSFRARWISGSPQFRFELYYNKLARTVVLQQPDQHGTPGARNSTYEEDLGPTYEGLRHSPAVPAPGQAIEVSTIARDPSGVASMSLQYGLNGGGFASVAMSLDPEDGRWKGMIPGQSNGTAVQFYLVGQDDGPNSRQSVMPPGGSRSRAIIEVGSTGAQGAKHSVRINMLPSEASALHVDNDILSNHRFGCTIITDEKDIAYDSGIRLRGSMFSRRNSSTTALNLKFPSDRRYRGVHSTITTRRGNRREILVKHIINHAGGIHDNYNDILYQFGHVGGQTGPVRAEMARFSSNYLRGLPGGNGTDGTVFKMEGIRQFQATQDGSPNSPKTPFPIGWVSSFDIANQGPDKEAYRHNMRINSNFAEDDYESIMRMCETFSLSGQSLEDAVPQAIDVDRWTRQFAMLSLCGIGDTYSQGNPHNLNFYVRPGDGLVESIPWDWDFTFSRSTASPLWGNKNVSKIFARPVYARLFYGHLRHIIRRTFNTNYLSRWFSHYGTCSGENYSGFLNDVTGRANFVLSRLPPQVTFRITTNGGNAFSTSEPSVTLSGNGWIDVREIYLNEAPDPTLVAWIDGDSWELTAPVLPGPNTLSLVAVNHDGATVGSDSVVVTNTGTIEPAGPANLAISELMYHPAGNLEEEYLEVTNIGSNATVDLSGASFTEGIEFVFPANALLAPGERFLVVQDSTAFGLRHGAGLPVVGEFANETRLSNGGERLRLEGLGGEVIRDFDYDNSAPWPAAADGLGHSLVLIAPESDPDHANPLNWRASVGSGGAPGESDAIEFTGDPDGDDNRDGLTNFMNHALGPGGTGPEMKINAGGDLELRYSRNVGADDVKWSIEISENLELWTTLTDEFVFASESAPVNGVSTVVLQGAMPIADELYARLLVEKR